MTLKLEIYKCPYCGNSVEVLHTGDGQLACCGKPMLKKKEMTQDSSTEKHVPYVEKIPNGYKVRVGENAEHPMTAEHYIEWIELVTADGRSYKKFLKPGDKPEAVFMIDADKVTAREYCNLHFLWKNDFNG